MARFLLFGLCLILAGCSGLRESRVNPLNWFGRDAAASTPVEADALPQVTQERRPLISEILSVRLEAVDGGALLRVTARTDRQGYYELELVPNATATRFDTLVYDLRGVPPRASTPVGSPRSREVTVALELTAREVAQVKRIQVNGARNGLSLRN